MHRHPRRAHIILVVSRWWPMLRKLSLSIMCMPIGFWALLILQLPSSLFIFPSMYICHFTCYRFPGVVLWILQDQPLLSWRMLGTALFYYLISVNSPSWSALSYSGCFLLLYNHDVYPHRGWLPIFRIRNIPY